MATKTKAEECVECQAVFKVRYDLDPTYYKVCHCPFCGTELSDESYECDQDTDPDGDQPE